MPTPDQKPSFPQNCETCKNQNPSGWTGITLAILYTCPHMPKKGDPTETPCMKKGSNSAFDGGTGHPRPTTQTENEPNLRGGTRRTSPKRIRD